MAFIKSLHKQPHTYTHVCACRKM